MKKAYFVYPCDEYWGYVVHAESPEKARFEVCKQVDYTWEYDYVDLRANRYKKLDDKPINIQSLIDSGMDMTFEGDPIEWLDVVCHCEICQPKDDQ